MIKCRLLLASLLCCMVFLPSCGEERPQWKPDGYGEEKTDDEKPEEDSGENDPGEDDDEPVATTYHAKAKQTFDAIVKCYRVNYGAAEGLFNENYPKASGDGAASFLWAYDGVVAGAATLNRLGYDVGYKEMVDRFQAYYRQSGVYNVGGYGSSTDGTNGGGDRFFDDNAIVGIELVEAYEQFGDTKYLDWCARIVEFYNTAIDNTMGRALWWNESCINQPGNDSSNKPACANGYASWFLMRYYEVCPENEKAGVLALAKDLYQWLYDNLRDPVDNLYWNSKGADGTVNKTKWTYNSGAMIAGGVLLYKATGEERYLNEAKATAYSSYDHYVKTRNGISLCYPTNDPWFTIQMIKSYIELEAYDAAFTRKAMSAFISYLDYAWKNGRMSVGLFYEDWTGVKKNSVRDRSLLMQAAALESLGVVSLYKQPIPKALSAGL